MSPLNLPSHNLKIALLQPQIAPNTGNIARLCVATSTELHLVRPMGFVLSDRELKRSAMDYWPRLKLTLHDDTASFFKQLTNQKIWLFSSHGQKSFFDADFSPNDWLIFGSETKGIDESIQHQFPEKVLRIPQSENERCLNLSTAAGIALYQALRSIR